MSFVSPMAGLLAAAIAVPALLLLYFLKLRRRETRISSTLLWTRSVEDLEANTHFQRLRPSWLLALQLLLLALLIAALTRPILGGRDAAAGERMIVLVDVSASMATRDTPDGPTRLEVAQESAAELVERLGRRRGAAEAMLIAFGSDARIVSPFSSDRRSLLTAIRALEVREEPGRLGPALRLAQVYLGTAEDGAGGGEARVVLLGDGRWADEEGVTWRGGRFEFVSVAGPQAARRDNIGITILSARRDYADPAQVQLLVGLVNTSPRERTIPVRLEIDGHRHETRTVTVPAAEPEHDHPGEAAVRFRFINTFGGLAMVSIPEGDVLALDDTAGMMLLPARRAAMLVVHPDDEDGIDPFLSSVLEELQFQRIDSQPTSQFEAAFAHEPPTPNPQPRDYRLIVFDRVAPEFVPEVATLSFGAAPPLRGVSLVEIEATGRRFLSWDRHHPIMSAVGLDAVAVADPHRVLLPDDGTPLALGSGGTMIGLVERRGVRHLVVSFPLRQSNWPLHLSFAVFMQNAVDHLTLRAEEEAGFAMRSGRTRAVRAAAGVSQIRVTGPQEQTLDVRPDGTVTLGPFSRVGLYRAAGLDLPDERLVVNLLSETESDTRPVESVVIGTEPAEARRLQEAMPDELWPWLIGAALALLVIEWAAYTGRART